MPKITLLRDVRRPKREHEHHTPIQFNDRSKFWSTYYNSALWRTTRLEYKSKHPICERCLHEGRVTPMTDVHHMCRFGQGRTASERWQLLTDMDNLVSLCSKCHHEYILIKIEITYGHYMSTMSIRKVYTMVKLKV